MDTIKTTGSEMKALAEMFKAPDSFDHERAVAVSEAVASHAETIAELLLPEGSARPPSRASDAIRDDFVGHAADLQQAAPEFGAAAEAGTGPAELETDFDAMASGCRACYEDFRLPG